MRSAPMSLYKPTARVPAAANPVSTSGGSSPPVAIPAVVAARLEPLGGKTLLPLRAKATPRSPPRQPGCSMVVRTNVSIVISRCPSRTAVRHLARCRAATGVKARARPVRPIETQGPCRPRNLNADRAWRSSVCGGRDKLPEIGTPETLKHSLTRSSAESMRRSGHADDRLQDPPCRGDRR